MDWVLIFLHGIRSLIVSWGLANADRELDRELEIGKWLSGAWGRELGLPLVDFSLVWWVLKAATTCPATRIAMLSHRIDIFWHFISPRVKTFNIRNK